MKGGRSRECRRRSSAKKTRLFGRRSADSNISASMTSLLLLICVIVLSLPLSLSGTEDLMTPKQNGRSNSSEADNNIGSITESGHAVGIGTGANGDGDTLHKDSINSHNKQTITKPSAEALRKKWKNAFEEIKSLVVEKPSSGKDRTKELLTQWKLLLDSATTTTTVPTATSTTSETGKKSKEDKGYKRNSVSGMKKMRFEGGINWERLLQQWADDAADYFNVTSTTTTAKMMDDKKIPGERTVMAADDATVVVDANATDVAPSLSTSSSSAAAASVVNKKQSVLKGGTPQLRLATEALLPSPRPVKPGEPVLPHTDLSDKSKNIWIVTTASLPWMTGTAVNPLLRAAYMSLGRKEVGGSVTLMLPWVEKRSDQERVYGKDRVFESKEQQETFVRGWLRDTANMVEASEELRIRWYTAWQERAENSLYAMGDITALMPADEVDICVLEEPEHLNWYRAPGESWTSKFKHVVGIVHTNYFVYAQEQPAAFVRAPAMRLLCSWMCRAHCHRVIKLSGTLGSFAPEKELVENVHGVRRTFLDAGEEVRDILLSPEGATHPVFGPNATPTVYFIGKMLWSKGLGSLMDLVKYAEESAGLQIKVDMYGGGPDKDEAEARAKKMGLDMPFHGPLDHGELTASHKIFVNPSESEVLCTTVAEALAMGKFVVLPSHPSNDFFEQFPNCLPYTNKEEFVGNLYYAFTHSPEPLTEEYAYALSWQAATERFAAAGSISVPEAEAMKEALSAKDAGVEIDLPPLIENKNQRKKIASSFRLSRQRYREFRSRLSQEISQSNVLPKDVQQQLVTELDTRLNFDLDKVLSSPKLRLKLSPAELDKRLLDFYVEVTKAPYGDVLRIIGGGATVGKQNLYLKQLAREREGRGINATATDFGLPPGLSTLSLLTAGEDLDAGETSEPTRWVKRALSRNLFQKNLGVAPLNSKKTGKDKSHSKKGDGMQMSLMNVHPQARCQLKNGGSVHVSMKQMSCQFIFPQQIRPRSSYSPLI